jgi:hypothetical protein
VGGECTERTDNQGAYDAIVLGAGISGLVSAALLLEQGNRRVLVVDEYPQVGGNHLDFRVGDYTFDVGSLIFQDDSPLLRHFPEVLPQYVPIDPSWVRVNPQGMITAYPFSFRDDFLRAGLAECARIVLSAALARVRYRRMRTARDFARFWIGPRLSWRSGLENYMERFCGLPAELIDVEFAEKRMGWLPKQASLGGIARQLTDVFRRIGARRAGGAFTPLPSPNQQLVRPREGFAELYRPAVERLEARGVTFRLGARVAALRKDGDCFQLSLGDATVTAERVISTIPLSRACELIGMPAGEPLPSVTLISLFFSFAGDRGFTAPILYNFSHGGAWKRLTVYSDFYGRAGDREFFTVEVIGGSVADSVSRAESDFREHAGGSGLFSGDLRLEGHHVLEQAYPIYTAGTGDRARETIAALRALGIESFGRQGGYQYQPTARHSTLEAEAALAARP